MDCPRCDNKLKVLATGKDNGHVYRILGCKNCNIKYTSEEILYPYSSEKGDSIKYKTYHIKRKRHEANIAMRNAQRQPKGRRKVAGPPKPVKEGEVYLTYGEIFEKFKKRSEAASQIVDYKPYTLLDHSIIVWYQDGAELAMEYRPDIDCFFLIPNAKTYEEILNEKARK